MQILKSDRFLFLSSFLQSPSQIGSITPSSRFLAKSMLKRVNFNEAKEIVELGPGTGVFTKYIVDQKMEQTKLYLFEKEESLRQGLQERYPEAFIGEDASKLVSSLENIGVNKVDYIISGLPFMNFPHEIRKEILDQVYMALKPNGMFITFQYSLQMKKMLSNYFVTTNIEFQPLNIPPAFIYYCRK